MSIGQYFEQLRVCESYTGPAQGTNSYPHPALGPSPSHLILAGPHSSIGRNGLFSQKVIEDMKFLVTLSDGLWEM